MSLTLRKSVIAWSAGAALMLSACDASSDTSNGNGETMDDGANQDALQLIYEVTGADFAVLESFPLQLQVTAQGTTRTGGWTDATLVLDQSASDLDTLVYRFMAARPTGMATQAFSPIEATVRFMPFDPEQITEVQIIAARNELTLPLSGE